MKKKLFIIIFSLMTSFCWAVNSAPQKDRRAQAESGVFEKMGQAQQKVSDKASELVANAMQLLGVPYRIGGTNDSSGYDCSGFVRAMYEKTIGLVLPHNAREQAYVTEKIDPTQLQPGDLVFFNTMKRAFSHVGIYLGDGKFIHSPRTGSKVRIEDMRDAYWERRFNGARRVPIEDLNSQYFIQSIKSDLSTKSNYIPENNSSLN